MTSEARLTGAISFHSKGRHPHRKGINKCTCDPVCRLTENGLATWTPDDRVSHATTVDEVAALILESFLYPSAYNDPPSKNLFHKVLAYIYFTEPTVTMYREKPS